MAYQVIQTKPSSRLSRLGTALARGFGGYWEQKQVNEERDLKRELLRTELESRERTAQMGLMGNILPAMMKRKQFEASQWDAFVKDFGKVIGDSADWYAEQYNTKAVKNGWATITPEAIQGMNDIQRVGMFGDDWQKQRALQLAPPELRQVIERELSTIGTDLQMRSDQAYDLIGRIDNALPEEEPTIVQTLVDKIKSTDQYAKEYVRSKPGNVARSYIPRDQDAQIRQKLNDIKKMYMQRLDQMGYVWDPHTQSAVPVKSGSAEGESGLFDTSAWETGEVKPYVPERGAEVMQMDPMVNLFQNPSQLIPNVANYAAKGWGGMFPGAQMQDQSGPPTETFFGKEPIMAGTGAAQASALPPAQQQQQQIQGLGGMAGSLGEREQIAGRNETENYVRNLAGRMGVSGDLAVRTLIEESNMDPNALGDVGKKAGPSYGLGQIATGQGGSPGALQQWNEDHPDHQLTAQQLWDPKTNMLVSVYYLSWLQRQFMREGYPPTDDELRLAYKSGFDGWKKSKGFK